MAWGFERGRIYNRRAAIHARFGGQQQGGIITPAQHALVIVITGEAGLSHGYSDRELEDGTFEYFGEGQIGDMPLVRGNAAIRDHSANGKSLLLFQKTKAGLKFIDEMVCAGFHYRRAPDTEGKDRQAIVFELKPLSAVVETVEQSAGPAPAQTLEQLRALARAAAQSTPGARQTTQTVYERSSIIRDYVVARSGGNCEGCSSPAPFKRTSGVPYLEPHHINRLSDGGPDDPRLVIALCPNCHRRVHSGADGSTYNDALRQKMKTIEKQ